MLDGMKKNRWELENFSKHEGGEFRASEDEASMKDIPREKYRMNSDEQIDNCHER